MHVYGGLIKQGKSFYAVISASSNKDKKGLPGQREVFFVIEKRLYHTKSYPDFQ